MHWCLKILNAHARFSYTSCYETALFVANFFWLYTYVFHMLQHRSLFLSCFLEALDMSFNQVLLGFIFCYKIFRKQTAYREPWTRSTLIAHDILKIGDQLAMLAYYPAIHQKRKVSLDSTWRWKYAECALAAFAHETKINRFQMMLVSLGTEAYLV